MPNEIDSSHTQGGFENQFIQGGAIPEQPTVPIMNTHEESVQNIPQQQEGNSPESIESLCEKIEQLSAVVHDYLETEYMRVQNGGEEDRKRQLKNISNAIQNLGNTTKRKN